MEQIEERVKQCKKCGVEKPFTEYFFNRASNVYEGKCKSCKKEDRKQREKKTNCEKKTQSAEYTKIEPSSVVKIEKNSKPSKSVKAPVNFDHWEKRYGRVLNEAERLEILHNVGGFFKILIEEYQYEKVS